MVVIEHGSLNMILSREISDRLAPVGLHMHSRSRTNRKIVETQPDTEINSIRRSIDQSVTILGGLKNVVIIGFYTCRIIGKIRERLIS